jgi:hypothetical protein
MTQEQKELLLKDLCARLSYGVKISVNDKVEILQGINTIDNVAEYDSFLSSDIEEVKPYLFPLSSMTEEQTKEYEGIIYKNIELHCERYYDVIDIDDFDCLIDFYHKYHLDYRGLIRLGLAIDATGLNIY